MSDILPTIEPETQGQVTRLDVPVSRFLSESFRAGQDESMYHSVSNITEDEIRNKSRVLQPDEANEKYGVGDLKFTDPVDENMASAMSEREKTKMDRDMWLYSGASKARFIPGTVASILGATANPLDFGSMFIPFVGEAGKIPAVTRIGRIMQRGLIPAKSFADVPASKLVSSMAQAGIWQATAEIPRAIEAHIEHQPMPDITLDEAGQMALAGVLHGVGVGLRKLSSKTHDLMTRQAFTDFMMDRDSTAHEYIPLDEHVIQFKTLERETQLRADAEKVVDVNKIAENYKDKNLEYSVNAALREQPDSTGQQKIHTGATHWSIPGNVELQEAGAERGMWTNKGRFVTMDEAQKLHGLPESDHPTSEQILYGAESPDEMSPDERRVYSDLLDRGYSDAQAMNTVRSERKTKMENHFFSKPEVQAEIERQRQAAIDKFVENRKAQDKNTVSQEVKRAAVEQTVPPEHVEKYNGDETHLNKALDEDIEGLGAEPQKQKDHDEPNSDRERYDKLQESLKGKTMDESQETMKKIEQLKNKYDGKPPPEKTVYDAIDAAVNCALEKLL